MSDSGGPGSKLAGFVAEAVIKPVQDEVGKALEVGVQSITGQGQQQLDPQEEANKKQEEELKKQRLRDFLRRYSEDQQRFQQTKNQEQQAKQAKIQEEQQAKQVRQVEVIEKQKKQQSIVDQTGKGRAEVKKGIGG